MNPLFLVLLTIILLKPLLPVILKLEVRLCQTYQTVLFQQELLEGYNTMDGLAGLAFGMMISRSNSRIGATETTRLASETVKSGIFSLAVMALIFLPSAFGTKNL